MKKRLISILLTLVLVLSLMPVMSLRVEAATDTYTDLIPTAGDDDTALASKVVHFNGYDWYIIKDESSAVDAGTVTLFAKDPIGVSKYNENSSNSNYYSESTVAIYLQGLTSETGTFANVANAIVTIPFLTTKDYNNTATYNMASNVKLYLLSTEEATALPENIRKCSDVTGTTYNYCWLRSPGHVHDLAAYVFDYTGAIDKLGMSVTETLGVRPALKLNLAAVTFNSATNTFTPGAYIDYFPNGSDDAEALAAKVVKFNNMDWYIIGDNSTAVNAGTVTLLAKDPIDTSMFDDSATPSNDYGNSYIKGYLDDLTKPDRPFANVANAIVGVDLTDVETNVSGAKLWLLSVEEANALPANVRRCSQATGAYENAWWLRSPGAATDSAKGMSGKNDNTGSTPISETLGVRPTLKLNLAYVDFASNTFTVNKYCPGITTLGTGVMAPPSEPADKDSAWAGSYVYYGKYDGTPTKYRVLAPSTNIFGGNTMFLDCDTVLFEDQFRADKTASDANQWSKSDVRTKLNDADSDSSFLNTAFSAVERAAIAESTRVEHELASFVTGHARDYLGRKDDAGEKYYTPLDRDKIFLLDVEDVLNKEYGYFDYCGFPESGSPPFEIVDNHKKSGDSSSFWWLRSPHSNFRDLAGIVDTNGDVTSTYVNYFRGVSPAFNVSLSSVIFSSLVSGTSGNPGAEYKLTLKDPNLTIAAGAVQDETVNNKYHISYAITDNSSVSTPTQVSVVVTDGIWSTESGWSNATQFQYAKLDMDSFALTGTGTFTLDTSKFPGTWGTNSRVYVLAEAVNTGNATDYASEPLAISLPSYGLMYDANDGSGLMPSMNVCENDMFTFPACGFTAPAGKTFDHWKMSGVDGMHQPGDKVKIISNCADNHRIIIVTAHWKDLPAATVTALPTAKDLTYNGSEQELVTAGSASNGTMQYAIGTNATTSPTTGWSETIPKGTTAGNYYVWYKAKGDGTTYSDSTPVPLTVTIKNKPSPPSPSPTPSYTYYTVKFEMNGHGEQVNSQTVRSGQKAKEPSYPTAEEYYFAGWFEDATLTKEYDFSSPVKKNTTLYARWEEILYVVSFDLDGKGSIEPQWVRKNKTAERPEDPTTDGYTFDGWYTSDGTAYDFSTPVTKDITIYAKWEKVIPPVIVHRLYNPNSGEHFYTADDTEKDVLIAAGWSEENGFMVPAEGTPVYRLYNPNGNDHHFTNNRDEAELLKSLGWIDEGIAFYTSSDGIPVYRAYNPYSGYHFFTADKEEFDYLITLGWKAEGIAWYAVA